MNSKSRTPEGGANSLCNKLSHWREAPIARRVSERAREFSSRQLHFHLNPNPSENQISVNSKSRTPEGGANSLCNKLSHWREAPIARRVSERSSRILLSPAPFSLNVPNLPRKIIHCCMNRKVTTLCIWLKNHSAGTCWL